MLRNTNSPKGRKYNTYTKDRSKVTDKKEDKRIEESKDESKKDSMALARSERSFRAIRRVLTWLITLLSGLCFLALVVFGLFHAYRFVTSSEFFAIERIDIRGSFYFERSELLELAELKEGMNSLQVSIKDIEKRLKTNPWIAEVSVFRRLPDRFEIQIKEWQPHFWQRKNDTLFYSNIYGEIIAPVTARNFISLPMLEFGQGGLGLLPLLPEIIAAFKSATLPVDMQGVSWIMLSAGKGFEFFLEKQQMSLSIAPDNWQENLERLIITLHDLAKRGELKKTASILASEGNVWVSFKN